VGFHDLICSQRLEVDVSCLTPIKILFLAVSAGSPPLRLYLDERIKVAGSHAVRVVTIPTCPATLTMSVHEEQSGAETARPHLL